MTKKCKNFRAFPRFRDFSPKDANVIPFLKGHSNLNQTHETSPPSKERWNFVDLKTILAQKQIKPIAVDMHFFYIFWKHGIVWRKVDATEQACMRKSAYLVYKGYDWRLSKEAWCVTPNVLDQSHVKTKS